MRRSKVKGIRLDKCIFTDMSRNMIDVPKHLILNPNHRIDRTLEK